MTTMVGDRMMLLRMENNITVEELAEKTGYSTRTIYRYEKNDYLPSIEYMIHFTRIFQISIDDLIN